MNKMANNKSDNLYTLQFYMAYLNFRKKLISYKFPEEEWKKAFEIERPLVEIPHPEDFE